MARYAIAGLRDFGVRAIAAVGAGEDEAAILADCLIDAQLRTAPLQNQGVVRFAIYARRVREGGITPRAAFRMLRDRPAAALVDGGNGFGQVVAYRAMSLAMEKARACGIGAVAARNSNHFGTASYFALMAARAGLVGLAFTNASPEMPAWGASVPLVGTNPWSIAVPGPEDRPVVLDISNAASGKRLIREYAAAGRPIPAGWAMDRDGRPVTDARAAVDALLAPIGGYKGYGIAVMVDLLTGGLAGGRAGSAVGSPYDFRRAQGVSHLLAVIDPEAFAGSETLRAGVDAVSREVHGAPRQPGVDAVRLPGDPEWERRDAALARGAELLDATVERLRALGDEVGVPFPAPLP